MKPLATIWPGQLAYDGLWQCLCPSLTQVAFHRVLRRRTLIPSSGRPVLRRRLKNPQSLALGQTKLHSTVATAAEALRHEDGRPFDRDARDAKLIASLLQTELPPTAELDKYPIEAIESAIHELRAPIGTSSGSSPLPDRFQRIIDLVTHILTERDYPLCPFVYESLADALSAPQGSARALNKLLWEMGREGIQMTPAFCEAALAVLANHPDYSLREEVMGIMKEYWFDTEGDAMQYYVLGLLRDEQYELAFSKLHNLVESGRKDAVKWWVLDIFAMVFGKMGFLDEMLTTCGWRKDLEMRAEKNLKARVGEKQPSDKLRVNVLYHLLDACSAALHHEGTLFAWEELVLAEVLFPADGILENVASTAARHGDTKLASEVLDMFSHRSRVEPWQYEAVAEAFLRAEDFAGAFRLFDIMARQGFAVSAAETQLVYEVLSPKPELCEAAEDALQESVTSTTQLIAYPLVASVVRAIAETKGSLKAVGLYRDIKRLCNADPESRLILTMVIYAREDKLKQELIEDYKNLRKQSMSGGGDEARSNYPIGDWLSEREQGHLIVLFSSIGELDTAYELAISAALEKTEEQYSQVSFEWVKTLVRASVQAEDRRVWDLLDAFSEARNAKAVGMLKDALQDARVQKGTSSFGTQPISANMLNG